MQPSTYYLQKRPFFTGFLLLMTGLLMSPALMAQSTFKFKGVVVDSLTHAPLPYLSVYNVSGKTGSLTRPDGSFTFERVKEGDELIFRQLGYKTVQLKATLALSGDTLYIPTKDKLFDEVVILSDDAVLYNLMARVKPLKTNRELTAKSYYQLESFRGNQQMELYQSYNNGKYNGYRVSGLEMKAGRFFLAPVNGRIFMSKETSKTFYMHRLFKPSAYFPKNPFELNRKKLRKSYHLRLDRKYKKGAAVFYEIRFDPKDTTGNYFKGSVTLDSLTASIHQVNLHAPHANVHPFISINKDSLTNVALSINKKFTRVDEQLYPESVNFQYQLTYKTAWDSVYTISSHALLYAYNYTQAFRLPYFDFPENAVHIDYRQVQAMPYNALFWKCTGEFSFPNSARQNAFIAHANSYNNTDFYASSPVPNQNENVVNNFYEHPFIDWNKGNRIILKPFEDTAETGTQQFNTLPTLRYELVTQLYLDLNLLCDSLHVTTAALFDPYGSYYRFPMTNEGKAFINMYFDLAEIERRHFLNAIENHRNDIEQIVTLYEKSKANLAQTSATFLQEVQRGTRADAMRKWNTYIKTELGVDNFSIFALPY